MSAHIRPRRITDLLQSSSRERFTPWPSTRACANSQANLFPSHQPPPASSWRSLSMRALTLKHSTRRESVVRGSPLRLRNAELTACLLRIGPLGPTASDAGALIIELRCSKAEERDGYRRFRWA